MKHRKQALMGAKIPYGIKYCGGCNSRFDRVEAARLIEARLGETILSARPGEHYDEIFVICGCPARCAELTGLSAGRFTILDSMGVARDCVARMQAIFTPTQ